MDTMREVAEESMRVKGRFARARACLGGRGRRVVGSGA